MSSNIYRCQATFVVFLGQIQGHLSRPKCLVEYVYQMLFYVMAVIVFVQIWVVLIPAGNCLLKQQIATALVEVM